MRENGKPYEGPAIQLLVNQELEFELTWRNSVIMAYADWRLNYLRHVNDDEVYAIPGESFNSIAEVLKGLSFPIYYKPCIEQAREDWGEQFGKISLLDRIHVSPFYAVQPEIPIGLPNSQEPAVLTWQNTCACIFSDDSYNHVRYRNASGSIDILSSEKLLESLMAAGYPYEFRPEVDEQAGNWFAEAELRKTPAKEIVRRIVESD